MDAAVLDQTHSQILGLWTNAFFLAKAISELGNSLAFQETQA